MIVFAADSAGKTAGAALLQDGTVLFEKTLHTGFTHSETLLPLIDEAFAAAKLTPSDVDAFAVTIGPGSFTGLRIGLALVKGLAFPFSAPCAPVSTLEALAAGYPGDGLLLAAQDARRGEVYWALFEKSGSTVTRLTEDAASPADIALAAAQKNQKAHPFILLGDGAGVCYNKLSDSSCAVLALQEENRPALGAALCGLSVIQNGQAVPARALQPHYLRLCQAERERLEKCKAAGKSQ